jgi:hypothetical protein
MERADVGVILLGARFNGFGNPTDKAKNGSDELTR